MAEHSDRVVIKFGPGRLDADRAIQREIDTLREEVETKTTLPAGQYPTVDEVEDIVTEVINNYPPVAGGGGFVIGIPPGTALAYAPLNLVNFPIDLRAVTPGLNTGSFRTNWPAVPLTDLSTDKANVLGYGTDTILALNRSTYDLVALSPDAGVLTTVDFPAVSNIRGFFSISGAIVANASSTSMYLYDGTIVKTFPYTVPSGSFFSGMGPNHDNTKIFVVWGNTSTQTLTIQQYDTNGLLEGAYTHTGLSGILTGNTNNNQSLTVVDNGWMATMAGGAGSLYVRKAIMAAPDPLVFGTTLKSLSSPNVFRNSSEAVSILPSGKVVTQSIATDGTRKTDLIVCDYTSSATTVYSGAIFNPYDLGDRPYLFEAELGGFDDRSPTAFSIVAIDETKFVVTGGTKIFDGTDYYDIPVSLYITIIDDPDNPGAKIFTNAYISHEDYAYINNSDPDTVFVPFVANIATLLPDGSVAYVIGNASGLPLYCIMFNVKAVDYTP